MNGKRGPQHRDMGRQIPSLQNPNPKKIPNSKLQAADFGFLSDRILFSRLLFRAGPGIAEIGDVKAARNGEGRLAVGAYGDEFEPGNLGEVLQGGHSEPA